MTIKEFQIQNKNKLDDEFIQKYPNGRITLERRKDGSFAISLGFKRNTSKTFSYRFGIVWENSTLYPFDGLVFSKQNHYNDISDALNAAHKFNFPEKLIKAFKLRYKGKDSKKFPYNNPQEIEIGSMVKIKNREKDWHRDIEPDTIFEVGNIEDRPDKSGYVSTILTLKGLDRNYSTKEESVLGMSRPYYATDFDNVNFEANLLNNLTNR